METLSWLRCDLGEGARNVNGALHIVDLLAGTLFRYDQAGFRAVVQSVRPIGAMAPVTGRPSLLVLAEGLGVSVVDLDRPTERLRFAVELADGGHNRLSHRVNDAACDAFGSFWVGTMPYTDGAPGGLFRVTGDGRISTVMEDVACPNGPAFGPDAPGTGVPGVVYVADTVGRTILRARLDEEGTPGDFTPFARVADGLPDGMTVDDDGCLWVAIWGAGEVRRYAPTGRLVETRTLPARQPTSVCLLPVDGTPALVVTTARTGLEDPGEGDGLVWVDPCSATAPPTRAFAWAPPAA